MSLPIQKAVIEVCGSCNYKCEMCPQTWGREKSFKRVLNFDLFNNILDQLLDSEVKEIYLEGSGEPFMNKRLDKYVKAGTDKGFKISFITNGSLMQGDLMKRVMDAGLNFARISVTGYNRELYKRWMSEDWFDKVLDLSLIHI